MRPAILASRQVAVADGRQRDEAEVHEVDAGRRLLLHEERVWSNAPIDP